MPRRARNNNTNSGSNNNNQQNSPRSVLNRKIKPRTQRRQRRRTPAPPPSPVSPQHRLSPGFLATMWGWASRGYFSNTNNNRN